MTALSATLNRRQALRRRAPGRHAAPVLPLMLGVCLAVGAAALIACLLWPTWTPQRAGDPGELPVSVGATLFNVPTYALRRNVQKHSGAQDRIDLDFAYPSLGPPAQPRRISAADGEIAAPAIDVIFLSIALADETVAPEERRHGIYPRYLGAATAASIDGLTVTPFRDGTPYAGEDLVAAEAPALVARCTRDTLTPGMCIAERRIGGADLTFRFPRRWLGEWRDVAGAMEQLIVRLYRAPG